MNPELFGDLGPLLFRMSDFVPTEVSQVLAPGSDGLFLARWTYLSFVIVYRGTANHDGIQLDAHVAINRLSRFRIASGDEQSISGDDGDGDDENALRNAQRIDDYFESATQFCMYDLREVFETSEAEMTEEQVREVLARDHEVNICMLERFALVVDHVANIDRAILRVTEPICDFSRGLIQSVRGAHFYQLQQEDPIHPIQFFVTTDQSSVYSPQFIVLHQRLRFLCSYSSKLRDIIDGRGNGAYQEILESLGTLWSKSDKLEVTEWSGIHGRHLMERQLWRLQDLRDGGGFGFWVEMFFLVAQQLLTLSLPPDAHSFLIIGMFGTITSNWRQHKHSIGTQRVILNLICDMAILRRGLSSDYNYPRYITDELLILMEKMVEGGLVRILMMQ
ncbi:hypothetical protein EI94DRAFT_1742233 [Lactarius quietus]|nr:hypothetical protein EI94DRAFT_1742233 [Lactarius quietus]